MHHVSIIRRVVVFLLSSVCLLTNGCLGLRPGFAGLYALVPRVIKVCVTGTSAGFEPRATATATTHFAGFRDDAAFRTYGTDGRRSDGWCLYVDIGQRHKEKNAIIVTI